MEGHEGSINAICLTSDSGLLASCSDDGTARVWDTETLELVSEMKGHTQYINCVTITANDEFVITGIGVCLVSSGRECRRYRPPQTRVQ